ncbi:MFS transporter [Cylindrospermopsis raciborskii S07]|uniref:MFS transporter n=1 Tax=Cylindrospermopsis raciborskii C07 TaxID=2014886 RepID=A0ABX4WN70_9CYAN|nr:MFS transporter [Cylindrospermopsis raciborskii]PNJ95451.1 MFS transporter [Cylindrospermopsis raciborskii C03]PNJ96071.1 MFS transporter [Cylindrospermopsis raciborskii C07]PNJ98950.1 MFS transporter [Cylindrospermopsis raciborskii C04]PNK06066.1 MFS transporter [Cylindrospermopsis raciborskii S10]PNK09716.1 MFS transporter [Cylindrospermopsis raciborskii S14]
MRNSPSLDPDLRKNLVVIFTCGLLFWSALASLLPTLPLYIESLGSTKQQIGIVMGSFAVGVLVFRPQVGKLADRQGRKLVLLIGMVVATIAPLGYLAVKSLVGLMLIRAFHGISIAAFATAYIALVSDLAPNDRRGEIIGYMSLVNPIGVAVGPALGGYLQAIAGYTPLFIFSGLLAGLGLICVIPITNPPTWKNNKQETGDDFWGILISPRVRVPTIILLMIGFSISTIHTFIALYIKSIGVDLNAGLFFAAAAISSFVIRLFVGRASDKYGRGLFVTLSLIAYSIAMLIIWQANSSPILLLGAIVEGAASGIAIPMISAMMTDRALPHERGRIFSVSLTGFDLGLGIAGPVVGYIAQSTSYRHVFGLSFSLTLLAIFIFISQSNHGVFQSLRFALGRSKDVYQQSASDSPTLSTNT